MLKLDEDYMEKELGWNQAWIFFFTSLQKLRAYINVCSTDAAKPVLISDFVSMRFFIVMLLVSEENNY
jgi:hypothetical protein